jgi:hypothetical protein
MHHDPFVRPGVHRVRSASRLAVLGLATVAVAACSSDPTSPDSDVGSGPSTGTGTGSGLIRGITVQQYFASAMDTIQGVSINEAVARSNTFRQKYVARATSRKTYKATYPVIDSALTELDPHSSLYEPTNLPGSTDAPTDRPDLRVQGRMLAANRVGYVWVPGFIGRSQVGRADSTHQVLRGLDANDPCGWIVDLRANSGGFVYGLMLSVGPLYAPSGARTVVGGQKYSGSYVQNWYYRRSGSSDFFGIRDSRDSVELELTTPWRPKRPGLPVAVLHSTTRNASNQLTSITASAGESIALAFRGGPPTRSFGAPTYGVASGRYPMFLIDSARVDITDSYMFDRTGFTPGNDPIRPDVTVANPSTLTIGATDAVVQAAIDWLQSQPACAATTLADRAAILAPRLNVLPAPLAATAPEPASGRRVPRHDANYGLPDAGLRLLR